MAEEKQTERIPVWREAMAQLRYLNNEVWKRFQFFVWLELVFLLLAGGCLSRRAILGAVIFLLLGLAGAFIARFVLQRNRIYYLQMLVKKSLLEDELGFYGDKFPGTETDRAFPWRLAPDVVQKIKADPEAWVNSSIRSKGTIARPLYWILETFIALNIAGIVALFWK